MEINEAISKCSDLLKITPEILSSIVLELTSQDLDFNKTWLDNDIDDLDLICIIIGLEKALNINIPNSIASTLISHNIKPKDILINYIRNEKLEKLGL
jgi:acyl carrier protein